MFSSKIASSEASSRSRGPTRSIGVSFMPSGIQKLVMQVVSSALPIAAPMRRQARPWAIQNSRMPESACDSVMLSAARGCEKYVGLKSRPICSRRAQSIHSAKCSGADGVAVDALAAEVAVEGVQVEAMPAGNQREGLFRVGAQLLGCARLARIVAGRRQPAAELHPELLEPADVISLPAVQRDRRPSPAPASAASASTPCSA